MPHCRRAYLALFVTALLVSASVGQPGSYREVSAKDKDVEEAAKFAVETRAKKEKEKVTLVEVVKAQSQVVAGRNLMITMDVRVEGGIRQAVAVVWAKLDRTKELTKWEWKGEAKPEEKEKP